MKLLLTAAEKKANTWLELDNESVGKVCKATALNLKYAITEKDKIYVYSAALLICSLAAEANADELKQTLEGLTIHGKPFGDWQITAKKLSREALK